MCLLHCSFVRVMPSPQKVVQFTFELLNFNPLHAKPYVIACNMNEHVIVMMDDNQENMFIEILLNHFPADMM